MSHELLWQNQLLENSLDIERLVDYSLGEAIKIVRAKENATPVWPGPLKVPLSCRPTL